MKSNTKPNIRSAIARSLPFPPRCSRLVVLVAGFVACATPARNAESRPLRAAGAGYQVQVLVDGVPAPTFWHQGESYVLGHTGQRYVVRVYNHTGRRVEAVVSVDGRDVVDGKPADFRHKRGYLVPAWGQVDIDGWRLSESRAAAFRFSVVADSYAARMGNAREVGVLGVAVFPERRLIPRPRPLPPPCCFDRYRGEEPGAGAAASEQAPAPAAPAASADAMTEGKARPGFRAAKAAQGPSNYASARRRRSGLGTEFGEAVASAIEEVEFVRAHPSTPSAILGLRYNDRDGLIAMGVDVDGGESWPREVDLRRTAEPFPVSPRPYATPPAGWNRYGLCCSDR